MADYTPSKGQPSALSFTAAAAITAGQLVEITAAGGVQPTAGPTDYIGVAGSDAAAGELVTVLCGGGVIHEHNTAAVVAAGTEVVAAAGGTLAGGAAGPNVIGLCVRSSALAVVGPPAVPAVPAKWLSWR